MHISNKLCQIHAKMHIMCIRLVCLFVAESTKHVLVRWCSQLTLCVRCMFWMAVDMLLIHFNSVFACHALHAMSFFCWTCTVNIRTKYRVDTRYTPSRYETDSLKRNFPTYSPSMCQCETISEISEFHIDSFAQSARGENDWWKNCFFFNSN